MTFDTLLCKNLAKGHPAVTQFPEFPSMFREDVERKLRCTLTESYYVREEVIQRYGFSVPCSEACQVLIKSLEGSKHLVDAGCGTGFWGSLIQFLLPQIKVTCLDTQVTKYGATEGPLQPAKLEGCRFTPVPVLNTDAIEFLAQHPETDVFTSWPDYENPFALNLASALQPGRLLIYIGEGAYGCTADDSFHELVGDEKQFELVTDCDLPQWMGIHDRMYIYRKGA